MSEGATAAEGASSGASSGAGMGGAAASVAGSAASNPSWYDSIAGAVKDYSSGSSGTLGNAIDNYQGGNYMKAAGYAGGKLQEMGSSGAGNPIPLINLPQGQSDTDPMSRYAQLYAQYRRR